MGENISKWDKKQQSKSYEKTQRNERQRTTTTASRNTNRSLNIHSLITNWTILVLWSLLGSRVHPFRSHSQRGLRKSMTEPCHHSSVWRLIKIITVLELLKHFLIFYIGHMRSSQKIGLPCSSVADVLVVVLLLL